jgi:hypothetical protein
LWLKPCAPKIHALWKASLVSYLYSVIRAFLLKRMGLLHALELGVAIAALVASPALAAARKKGYAGVNPCTKNQSCPAHAASGPKAGSTNSCQSVGAGAPNGSEASWREKWLSKVSHTQAAQPHWITPLVTVTPRLEQEFRYDFAWQEKLGTATALYGGGKGLELIPAEKLEVIIGLPSYNVQHSPGGRSGFADEPWLVKYRLFTSNEQHGNQILTFFLGASLPSGSAHFSMGHGVVTTTLAHRKGARQFDVQTTVGIGLPTSGTAKLGRPIVWNIALQQHVSRFLWPELEFNSTFWRGGVNGGKKQVFVTPGLVVGRIPLHNRLGLTVGVGLQVAATQFHTYNHAVILSFRLPF